MFRQRTAAVLAAAAVGFTAVISTTLAVPAAATPATAAVASSGYTQVTFRGCARFQVRAQGGLNIRNGPGTNFRIVDSIPNGESALFSSRVVNGFRESAAPGRWASNSFLIRRTSFASCPTV
jgi:uncharacterized protein YraI